MNVLMINGSPRINGNTTIALEEMRKAFINCDWVIVPYNSASQSRNMAFLMKSIALGKEQFGLPKTEEHAWTHFIR